MKKTNLVGILIFLISILTITNADFKTMSFKELTRLASADLGKNIYMDKDLPKYSVDINLADHQKRGEVYEYYKIVLYENNMYLDYNRQGNFYYVKNKIIGFVPLAPVEIHKDLKLHYYTYKIKNITNEDVVKSMSIFPNVKFQYLKQSDIIAYSATRLDHLQVKRILKSSDNAVLNATIKISLFSVNKNNIEKLGASISNFGYGLNTKILVPSKKQWVIQKQL